MDGIIIINKQKNYTSHDIVKIAKKTLNEKVGHTGTLDPNATGVLPLLIGKGTQLSKYLINHDKTYEAVLKLGEKKDTADSEGITIEKKDVGKLTKQKLETIFESLIGEQMQIPPMYSAIKVDGKKLYEYARSGQEVKIEPRTIVIYNLKLIHIDEENQEITYEVHCSKGTYIRTLCEEIAQRLGTVGYMKELKRTRVGEFKINKSIKIEELENKEILEKNFITIEKFFESKESLILDEHKINLFLNGVQLTYNLQDDIYKIYNVRNKFIGIGTIKNSLLKRNIIV